MSERINKNFPVLNQGFVRLVDVLGDDARVVQAARVSYGAGTKTVREDAGLIDYLMRHRHTSPFEMVSFTFHLKMPLFVARQWIRHRTASLNEISGRYSVMKEEFYLPEAAQVRYQSQDNKQGRGAALHNDQAERIIQQMQQGQEREYQDYEALLDDDVARELARINLPLSLYTEMYWQMDLHNLFHFLKLRMHHHSQYEIRVYAETIAAIVKEIVPLCYQAWQEHVLHGVNFSQQELALLLEVVDREKLEALLQESDMRKTRQKEFLAKLA